MHPHGEYLWKSTWHKRIERFETIVHLLCEIFQDNFSKNYVEGICNVSLEEYSIGMDI
jgi:hypothetical protein